MSNVHKRFFAIIALVAIAAIIALPQSVTIPLSFIGRDAITFGRPTTQLPFLPPDWSDRLEIKQGLDIQGGMQVVLEADMSEIPQEDREVALNAAREVILRRVDLYGIAEPSVTTAQSGDSYRILVELAGVEDEQQALSLVGQTAQLEFQLIQELSDEEASIAGTPVELISTGLTGQQLKRATVQFDQNTGEPIVGIEFNDEGRELFADITTDNVGESLAIFLDGAYVMAPTINQPIVTGQAVITGGFSFEEAEQLSIQLNAGALPIPITVLEQRSIGASLGSVAVRQSIEAGLLGLGAVLIFMVLYYGWKGFVADIALVIYSVLTIALYKILGVTLTLPGIAGLLLSIGMAVDANILIFERIKEEQRLGRPFAQAMELGFGRAWDSIKDANIATILTSLVLINPLNFTFLNTSGLVRGFGITLLIGVLLGLFTGVVVTRTLVRLFISK